MSFTLNIKKMELIKIKEKNGKQLVSARDLYVFLGFDTSQWSRWHTKNLIENDFAIENEDYTLLDTKSRSKDFALTLDFAKRISMMARTEKGEKIRKYFIECEKIAKDLQEINPKIPTTFREALLLAAEQQEIIEKQILQIEVMKPKEVFYDQVTGSETCFDMADVAKVCDLGIGRNLLFQFLRENNILRDNNTPYQQFVDNGYFRVIESKYNKPDGSVNISLKTVVYQKGIDFIIKKYNKLNL